MGLYKKEVLIRPVSTISVQGAKDFAKNWMNDNFQNVDENKDEDGNYIDYFFADIFDARDGNIYRVYTEACMDKYSMDVVEFDLLNTVLINEKIETIDNTVAEADEKLQAVEDAVYNKVEATVI